MICSKCKSKIKDGSKYCIRCGTLFVDYITKTEDELFELNILNKYCKEIKYDFSIKYFIFGSAYAFYKKLYYEGIIAYILTICDICILKRMGGEDYTSIVDAFIAAVIFLYSVITHLYYSYKFKIKYETNVRSIITKEMNNSKDKNEITKNCEKKLKNNTILAILSVILLIIIFII